MDVDEDHLPLHRDDMSRLVQWIYGSTETESFIFENICTMHLRKSYTPRTDILVEFIDSTTPQAISAICALVVAGARMKIGVRVGYSLPGLFSTLVRDFAFEHTPFHQDVVHLLMGQPEQMDMTTCYSPSITQRFMNHLYPKKWTQGASRTKRRHIS